MVKTCTKCKENKPLTEFYRNQESKDGRVSWCKPCASANDRARKKGKKTGTVHAANFWGCPDCELVWHDETLWATAIRGRSCPSCTIRGEVVNLYFRRMANCDECGGAFPTGTKGSTGRNATFSACVQHRAEQNKALAVATWDGVEFHSHEMEPDVPSVVSKRKRGTPTTIPHRDMWFYMWTRPNIPHLVKVGKSTDIPSRLSATFTDNPEPLKLISMVSQERAGVTESDLHNLLEGFGLRQWENREFFKAKETLELLSPMFGEPINYTIGPDCSLANVRSNLKLRGYGGG